MNLTKEQEQRVMTGWEKYSTAVNAALDGAQKALNGACDACWYRSANGCRGKDCPIWRVTMERMKCLRMMRRGKLMPNWYGEARAAQTAREVPFLIHG